MGLATLFSAGVMPKKARVSDRARSAWVFPGRDGRLVYKATSTGDRIMDFSHAGYMGGGVALPQVPVKVTVRPEEGDSTAAIQRALNEVASMKLEGGFRGAVLLAPGSYACSGTIVISASGVVLRGSGSGPKGVSSTIRMIGGRHSAFSIGTPRGSQPRGPLADAESGRTEREFVTASTSIADAYVPSGAVTFTASDASGFAVGDVVAIRRPITAAWVRFMQMHDLVRDGKAQTWINPERKNSVERQITAISGNRVTLDIPLSDSFDSRYLGPPGSTVVKVKPVTPPVTQAGIEHVRIQCPPQEMIYTEAPHSGIRINGEDCWVRDVVMDETVNSTTIVGRRITMEQVMVFHSVPNLGASKPTDFSLEGSQILLNGCSSKGDNLYFVWTGSLQPGPNVLLNCTFQGHGRLQPHQRWSTGLLVDNCAVPEGGIDFMNRGVMGSGHGWTMGWAVAWNCVAQTYVIQNPPGVMNWAIGCTGRSVPTSRPFSTRPNLPEGVFDSPGQPVAPQSLYLAQLAERLGSQAVKNIGSFPGTVSNHLLPAKSRPVGTVDKNFGIDLAAERPVNPSNVRGGARRLGAERALDGNNETYWTTDDGITKASIEVDLEGPEEINVVEMQEEISLGHHVESYRVEGQVDNDWKLLSEGTTIGSRKLDRFPKVTAWKVRLTILQARACPAIRKFGLYLDAGSRGGRP